MIGPVYVRVMQVVRKAEVDAEIAWAIVQNEIPPLLEKSESLLEESGHGG